MLLREPLTFRNLRHVLITKLSARVKYIYISIDRGRRLRLGTRLGPGIRDQSITTSFPSLAGQTIWGAIHGYCEPPWQGTEQVIVSIIRSRHEVLVEGTSKIGGLLTVDNHENYD